MKLEEPALSLLRSMKRTDGKKYTAGPIDRSKYERLEIAGLIKATPASSGDIVYTLLPAAEQHLQQT
jgi:hypothetical protein